MSWGPIEATAGPGELPAKLHDAKVAHLFGYAEVPSHMNEQIDKAIEAALTLLPTVATTSLCTVRLSGHSTPNHDRLDEYGDPSVTLSLYAVAP